VSCTLPLCHDFGGSTGLSCNWGESGADISLFKDFPVIEYKQPMLGAIGPVPLNAYFARSPADIARNSPLPGRRSQIDYFQTRPEIDALDDMFRQTNIWCANWLSKDNVMTDYNNTFSDLQTTLKNFDPNKDAKLSDFNCKNLTQDQFTTLKYCYNPKLFYYLFTNSNSGNRGKSVGWVHNTIMCIMWYDSVKFNSLGLDTWTPYASLSLSSSVLTSMYGYQKQFGLENFDYLNDGLSYWSGAVAQIVNGCPPRDVDLMQLLQYATKLQAEGRPITADSIKSAGTSSFKDDFYMNTLWCAFYDEPYSLNYYPSIIQTEGEKKNFPFRRLQRPIINDPCNTKVFYTKDKKDFTYGPRPWSDDIPTNLNCELIDPSSDSEYANTGGTNFGLHFLAPRWLDNGFRRSKSSLVNAFLTTHEEKLGPGAPAEELKDQCMGAVTASIIKMDFWDSTKDSTVNVKGGEQATWRDRFKGLGIADKILSKDAGVRTIHHALIDEINSMGTVGAFSPMQDFLCPMEVTFGDTRTSSMSYEQQFENIFASGVTMIKSIGKNAANMGKGCYMCVVPSGEDLYDTLSNEPLWMRHYDKRTCGVTAFLPAMESVPRPADNPTKFEPPQPQNTNADCSAADYQYRPPTPPPTPAPTPAPPPPTPPPTPPPPGKCEIYVGTGCDGAPVAKGVEQARLNEEATCYCLGSISQSFYTYNSEPKDLGANWNSPWNGPIAVTYETLGYDGGTHAVLYTYQHPDCECKSKYTDYIPDADGADIFRLGDFTAPPTSFIPDNTCRPHKCSNPYDGVAVASRALLSNFPVSLDNTNPPSANQALYYKCESFFLPSALFLLFFT